VSTIGNIQTCDCKVQKSNIFKVCVQNILHVLKCKTEDVKGTTWSINHLVVIFLLFDKTQLQLGNVINPAVIHMLLQLPPDLVVYWAEVKIVGWPGVQAMKSGISQVNSRTVFTCPMSKSIVLITKHSSEPVTALINAMSNYLFCHRYLKIYNSTVNEYFLMKFCSSFKHIYRVQCM